MLQARGRLGRAELEALRAEAAALAQSPLELLWKRGRISQELLTALRAAASGVAPAPTMSARATPDVSFDGTTVRDSSSTPGGTTDAPAVAGVDCSQPRDVPEFPIAGWDRYEAIRFLGQGGMGTVFLARDLRLQRQVAIKFVRGDNPVNTARLLAEARSQARVDHECVCKVYEVAEAQGESYIAMQFVSGQTLASLSRGLSVEQKVMVLRDAALGVQKAHGSGILHRDLKPGNIMVERAEDGSLKTYVMDFGLARAIDAGATETASVLGTPYFMPPEQARGEVSSLDRRADVYSLGASLYHLLTHTQPIPGANALEVLNNIASFEPLPLRRLDPDIPADIEAITLKCLEKDRAGRYDSARALAEDLDRFLRGDPVDARAARPLYRLRKRIGQHKRVVIASALALSALLAVLGYAVATQRQASTRERLAQRFTELVERVESKALYSALSPPHDIRGDQREIERSMALLQSEIEKAGPLGKGPGHYALGRGHMALGDDARARPLLESAWRQGYRQPRVAYALSLVFGHLYAARLREVQRIDDAERRALQQAQIERQYRDPAIRYLRQSGGTEVPSKAYLAAMVAFYEGRYERALQQLDGMGKGLPWFYEAPELRGAVLQARGARRWNEGDRDGAVADFEAAGKAYVEAAAIGQSAPAIYEALGELEYAALLMEFYGEGDVKPRFERGVAAVDQALAIQPDDYAANVLRAALYRKLAEHEADRGADIEALLTQAIGSAQRAVALVPERDRARTELASSYHARGAARQARALDPRADLQAAIDAFAHIPPAERGYDYYLMLGVIHQTWADYEAQRGLDSLAKRAQSVQAYQAATRLEPHELAAFINLGSSYYTRAKTPRSLDSDGDLERALSALSHAQSLNPKHVVPYFYENQARTLLALRARARGDDARPELEVALTASRHGLGINPDLWHLNAVQGLTLLECAREAWARGDDPLPLFDQAFAAQQRAMAQAPDEYNPHLNAGIGELWRARYLRTSGRNWTASLRAAISALQRATALAPESAECWAYQGQAHVLLAELTSAARGAPEEQFEHAREALAHALQANPRLGEAHFGLAQLRGRWALSQARRGQDTAADLEGALQAMQTSIELDPAAPEEPEYLLHFARFCADWAAQKRPAGHAPGALLQRGLELVERILQARRDWPEARALKTKLQTQIAQRVCAANECGPALRAAASHSTRAEVTGVWPRASR